MVRAKDDPHAKPRADINTPSAVYIPSKAQTRINKLHSIRKKHNDGAEEMEGESDLSDAEDTIDVGDEAENDNNELTDYENSEDGWTVRKSRYGIPKYGNAAVFVGRSFTISKENELRASTLFGTEIKSGIIHSVICQTNDPDKLYFKGYDHTTYRTVPTNKPNAWWIIECVTLMSSNMKTKVIDWDDTVTATATLKGIKGFIGEGMIGKTIMKQFGDRYYRGKITSYNGLYYGITYDDGDSEELSEKIMLLHLRA